MPELDRGAELFDRGEFYEAHEEWEDEWHEAAGDSRLLLHGLIQTAAAYVHLYRGNPRAVASLADSALQHLEEVPERHLDVDVEQLRSLNEEIEARATESTDSDDWRPLILRTPTFPWTDSDTGR